MHCKTIEDLINLVGYEQEFYVNNGNWYGKIAKDDEGINRLYMYQYDSSPSGSMINVKGVIELDLLNNIDLDIDTSKIKKKHKAIKYVKLEDVVKLINTSDDIQKLKEKIKNISVIENYDWVPCSEELPSKSGNYYIKTKNNVIYVAKWGGGYWNSFRYSVTHWKPILD